MRLICIKNTKSIYTDGHPVDQKYFKVGEQYDAQDDYKIDDMSFLLSQHFVIYDNGSRYSVYRRDFCTVENWRHKQLENLGI